MFKTLDEFATKIVRTGYLMDPVTTKVVYLAAKLQKPLLLEGPAGSGKTQLALSVAEAARTHVERLQCYRGVTEDKAIGHFDESLQRLYMEFSRGQQEDWEIVQANLERRKFFRPGPLMRALECEQPCVLLVDELDKVDEAFEAMLLEALSAWTLSIPELGTVSAKSIPLVVLTDDILYLLALELRGTRKRIGFALSESFRQSLLETRTLTNTPNTEIVLLRDLIGA